MDPVANLLMTADATIAWYSEGNLVIWLAAMGRPLSLEHSALWSANYTIDLGTAEASCVGLPTSAGTLV